jgi:hypothetical protein
MEVMLSARRDLSFGNCPGVTPCHRYNELNMIRHTILLPLAVVALLTGCGYHTVGAATHLPPEARTMAVPVFATHTEAYHTEVAITDAVIREFAARSRMRISPGEGTNPDVVLHGTILNEVVAPLTYNTTTQQSSS